MTLFGIRAHGGDDDEHYVSEDNILWDWLVAKNYEPSGHDSFYRVSAPAGYIFDCDNLYPMDDEELANRTSSAAHVTVESSENDKAHMLMLCAMRYVQPAEFYALGIDEARIRDYLIY